jgi:hypothetical protein
VNLVIFQPCERVDVDHSGVLTGDYEPLARFLGRNERW